MSNMTSKTDLSVLRICAAHESGFGHGLQGRALPQPYALGTGEHQAYQIGFDSGAKRRQSEAQPAASKDESNDIAAEISRKVFEELGNPETLPVTEVILTATLTSAFDNYRIYLQGDSVREMTQSTSQEITLYDVTAVETLAPLTFSYATCNSGGGEKPTVTLGFETLSEAQSMHGWLIHSQRSAVEPTPLRAGHIYSPREGTEVCFICGFHKSEHAPEHMPTEKAATLCTCVAGKLNWCAVHPARQVR
jgi:hypothetical protein